jgi:NADH-quinone oxidoreductase subunit E
MQRYDLRNYKDDSLYERMLEVMDKEIKPNEVCIFLFEIGDFSPIQKSFDTMKNAGHEVKNSLKFNELDWTLVVKRKAS